MASTTVSHEQLERDYNAIEKASHDGPVFITRDGQVSTVLLAVENYRRLDGRLDAVRPEEGKDLATLLAVPDDEYFEWEPERLRGRLSGLGEED